MNTHLAFVGVACCMVAGCAIDAEPTPTRTSALMGGSERTEMLETTTTGVDAVGRFQGILPPGSATGATRNGESITVAFEHPTRQAVRVTLPARATGAFELEDAPSDAWLRVSPRNMAASDASFADGYVIYKGAGPDGGDLFHRVTPFGTEDFVVLEKEPATTAVDYDVALSGTLSSLRLIGNTLEFLDDAGAPRFRVAEPYLVDARGTRRSAQLSVQGCAYDEDPRPPWGRKGVAPGATSCSVRVSWDRADVVYPALVDPAWTSTGSMVIPRMGHTATMLSSGLVLVLGGDPSATIAELYDPNTGTWATTGSTVTPHQYHTASLLGSNDRVLVVGGGGVNRDSTEIYDAASGTFIAADPLVQGRSFHVAVSVDIAGKSGVFVAGGSRVIAPTPLSSAAFFDASTMKWITMPSMTAVRSGPSASLLANGTRLLVTGGTRMLGSWSLLVATTEIFDFTTMVWTAAASMKSARAKHTQDTLASGKVLVTGTKIAEEIYDPSTNTWSSVGIMNTSRVRSTSTTLQDGRILFAGGTTLGGGVPLAAAELFDPTTMSFTAIHAMPIERDSATATLLPSGAVLVVGGKAQPGNVLSSAELFAFVSKGSDCTLASDCQTGLSCVDGVCCDKPCSGPCEVCRADGGAIADGVCTALAKGHPGQPACSGALLCDGISGDCPASCDIDLDCATTHHCDAGVCVLDILMGQACSAAHECVTGFCVDGVCCNGACDGLCQACSAEGKASGTADGVCGEAIAGTDPHNDCPDDGVLSCKRDGLCGADGACRLYAAGATCKAPSCVDNAIVTASCDGLGACMQTTDDTCGLSLCSAGACKDVCSDDSDCVAGAYCDAGVCLTKASDGNPCADDHVCASGSCTDHVCCNMPCDGQCESCAEPGALGICVPVAGAPRGDRPACAEAEPNAPCTAAVCDGVTPQTCEGFVGSSVVCAEASCSADIAHLVSSCDGKGQCSPQFELPCEPLGCEADKPTCKTSCTVDGDCAKGYACLGGTCLIGAVCLSDTILRQVDGKEIDCAPYQCSGGACLTQCADITDCSPGYACDTSRKCVDFNQDSGAFGCACAILGRGRETPQSTIGIMFVAMAIMHRRKSRKQQIAPQNK